MRRIWIAAAGAAAALAFAGSAAGNDSSAELADGGLVLTKSAAIEMQSENLFISPTQVRVDYKFANTSDKDVTVTVAFPMPDITTNGVDDMIAIPTQNPTNIMGFSTTVDGKPVVAQVEQKALKDGVDRTALLKSLGVPIQPHLDAADAALDKLPKSAQDQLLKLGMVTPNDYDAGHGMEHHLGAAWTLKTTYFWQQTFPAGKVLSVHHQYTPSLGGTAGTSWGTTYFSQEPTYAASKAKYCVDDDFIASARKTIPPGQEMPNFYEQRLEYILSSGANWKTPIGDFRMTVDKGAANNLVSFCGTGVVKISPTQFQVHQTNFTPTGDVSILLLVPPPKGAMQ
jgi:hypothetical protein